MKEFTVSARNALKSSNKKITPGAVNAEVVVEIENGIEIVSIITKESAERPNLTVGKTVHAVVNKAVNAGVPNLYAESAAQFLATHLLSLHSEWSNSVSSIRNPGAISDRRLLRMLEFMRHHYAENLSLAELARVAGVSRFHFVNLFKKACGATPHQFLIELRMNHAAALL